MRTLTSLCALMMFVGCSQNAPNPPKGEKTDDDKVNEILQIQDKISNSMALSNEIQKMKPVDPVPFEKLVALLPAAPAGYKAEDPRGENLEAGEFKHSFAERRFTKDDRFLEVKIHDCAQIKELYASIEFASSIKIRNSEGHHLGVTIDGNPGIEQYKKADQRGELTVLVGKRHFVVITADGIQPEFLRSVYNSIDTKKLAALK